MTEGQEQFAEKAEFHAKVARKLCNSVDSPILHETLNRFADDIDGLLAIIKTLEGPKEPRLTGIHDFPPLQPYQKRFLERFEKGE